MSVLGYQVSHKNKRLFREQSIDLFCNLRELVNSLEQFVFFWQLVDCTFRIFDYISHGELIGELRLFLS